jgi:hypothetical protein
MYKAALDSLSKQKLIEELDELVYNKVGYTVSKLRALEFCIFSISKNKR